MLKKKEKMSVSKDYGWSGKLINVLLPTPLSSLLGKQWETHKDQWIEEEVKTLLAQAFKYLFHPLCFSIWLPTIYILL